MSITSLHDRLTSEIRPALQKELKLENVNAVPRLEKVVVNVGLNKSKMDSKEVHAYVEETLMTITGQKPVFTLARKAISNFKIREGGKVGIAVTLRGKQMHAFLDRLIAYSIPRIRDFRGLPSKFDGHGNYAIGLKDHSIFPEVPPPDAKQIFGLQIQIKTTATDDDSAYLLLKKIGLPILPRKGEQTVDNDSPNDS